MNKPNQKQKPDPSTMPKDVYGLAIINPSERIWLNPEKTKFLDLSRGVVGSGYRSRPGTADGLIPALRELALLIAEYPTAAGKVGVYRCPFMFAPFDTFELIRSEPLFQDLADARIIAKYAPIPSYQRDAFLRRR